MTRYGIVAIVVVAEYPGEAGRLLAALDAIVPWDALERAHLADVRAWIGGGAPVYRIRKHRKAGLWLPAGGHVEPGEDPWDTAVRECREELGIEAVPSALSGDRPFFLTVARTRGQHGRHTDVALWYVLRGRESDVTAFDREEFAAIRWLPFRQALAEPAATLDPNLHRFVDRLLSAADPDGRRACASR